jgi:hypothetical protein
MAWGAVNGAFSSSAFSTESFSPAAFDFGGILPPEPETRRGRGGVHKKTYPFVMRQPAAQGLSLAEMIRKDDVEVIEILQKLFAAGVFDGS